MFNLKILLMILKSVLQLADNRIAKVLDQSPKFDCCYRTQSFNSTRDYFRTQYFAKYGREL